MKCIKCGETRESEFYPSSIKKYDYRCKACVKEYLRPYVREYMRKYMREHPEQNRANQKRWYAEHKVEQYARRKAYMEANRQRHNAQCAAFRQLGTQSCGVDGCFNPGERHHDDYSKPLEVRWLCRKHHKESHRKYQKVGVVE